MAVVMALLLVLLAASAASLVLWQQSLWWQQVEADRQRAQMRLLLDAGLSWARVRLRPVSPLVSESQPWAQPWSGQDGDYRWRARLIDLQSRLNLNALGNAQGLIDRRQLDGYRRLLLNLGLPEALAGNLVAWCNLSEAGVVRPVWRPPRPLRDWRDLGSVPGYGAAVLARLAPYVAVLPGELDEVNLNTASPRLLAALWPEAQPEAVAEAVAGRGRLPFRDVADFASRIGRPQDTAGQAIFGTGSAAFWLQMTVGHHQAEQRLDVVLKVEAGQVRVLSRPDPGALPPS